MLFAIAIWYTMAVPYIIASELEKIDKKTSFEGTIDFFGMWDIPILTGRDVPILIEAHAYVEDVKGDNVVLGMGVFITRNDSGWVLPAPFSRTYTYVFNKFTRENVKDSPDADKPREGYYPLYPSHLKADEDIHDVWSENLNMTVTLEFKESTKEEGVTLYKYFVNETITKEMNLPEIGPGNYIQTSIKTVLIEPLSGLSAYTENERFSIVKNCTDACGDVILTPLVNLTYTSTAEAKVQGIADAKEIHKDLQLLESYIPSILGVVPIVLIVGLVLNVRRLKRKESPKLEKMRAHIRKIQIRRAPKSYS